MSNHHQVMRVLVSGVLTMAQTVKTRLMYESGLEERSVRILPLADAGCEAKWEKGVYIQMTSGVLDFMYILLTLCLRLCVCVCVCVVCCPPSLPNEGWRKQRSSTLWPRRV